MKKRNLKIPTILGVLLLLSGLVAGIFLINSTQVFKLGAQASAIPSNVKVSNVTNSAFTVTWTTDIESSGFVKWGKNTSSINKVALEESSSKQLVHSANISGAEANSTTYFTINSDSKDFDNNGIAWQANTQSQNIKQTTSLIASGTTLLTDTVNPAKAIVSLSINGTLLSNITSDEGSWIIPVSSYLESIPDNTTIEIAVNAGSLGTSQAIIYPKALNAVPTMVLGKTYDFRSIVSNSPDSLPESSISIPESVEISSRFIVEKNETPENTSGVTIESIDNGEIITTTDPEFFGKGPQNTEIQITLESELQEVAMTTSNKGTWSWSPPNNLEPGEHKVTIKWKDATGIFRTITRSFVVQASEGPAFESTPSATPIVTASAVPSTTPKAENTPTTTAPPTPETGDFTPTIGLFMMGIGVLLSSLYIWNKSNVY